MLGEHERSLLGCILLDLFFCEFGQVHLESLVEFTQSQCFIDGAVVYHLLLLLEGFFGFREDDHFGAVGHGEDQIVDSPQRSVICDWFVAIFALVATGLGVQFLLRYKIAVSFVNKVILLLYELSL
jgi:hypothetical protein